MASAAQTLNLTSYSAALKVLYDGQPLEFLGYENKPFLDLVDKEEDFYGISFPVPTSLSNIGGGSNDFPTAQNNQLPAAYRAFSLTRYASYAVSTIDRQTLLASDNDKGAFMKARLAEFKNQQYTLMRNINIGLFGTGYGDRGVIGSIASVGAGTNNQIVLSNAKTVVNFETNMALVVGPTPAGTALRGGGTTPIVVTGRDAVNGLLTFGVNVTTIITGIAATDIIYRMGDFSNAATGLQAWIPSTAPTATDNFLGVNRSIDGTRLAGIQYNAQQYNLKDGLTNALVAIQVEGGHPDTILCSPRRWGDLSNLMDTKRAYSEQIESEAGWSYRTLQLDSPMGSCKVLADNACPDAYAYILQLDTWHIKSLGKLTQLVDEDGLVLFRVYNQDAFEVRLAAYWNLYCDAPGRNGVAILP
jgi:hypothetical protein